MESNTNRYGNHKITKMYQQWNDLRGLIRQKGSPAIQKTWDKVEEHIDFVFKKND